ncbi:MAG: type II toxin-antitoxin system VapC family toxin [Pyrinomonadaceae bacterium]
MFLLDSDIIIYTTKPEFDFLGQFLERKSFGVSIISFVEVMGYHKISEKDKAELTDFFESTKIHAISNHIANKAIELRQQRKMKLGDALIAATALALDCPLVTNNSKDFTWIDSIELIDPLENK